ncbi:MAG: DUF3465 domain-containing protein [Pseudomonadota bacterium]
MTRNLRSRRRPGEYGKSSWDEWIEDTGVVVRLLHDDKDGAEHQRFVLRLASGQTLLIAHNIDLAKRVPLGLGDRVRFRGVYEWNELGGVVHWTHRDSHGGADEGFVRFRDRTYW